jgi:hypothetical protein
VRSAASSLLLLALALTLGGCDSCNRAGDKGAPASGSSARVAQTTTTTTPAPGADLVVPKVCKTHCRIAGGCYFNGRTCVSTNDAHCRQAHACKVNGMCSNKDGRCIGTSDDDCKASQRCNNEGLCFLREGKGPTNCYAKSEADCKASAYCRDKGKCELYDKRCIKAGEEKVEPETPPPL